MLLWSLTHLIEKEIRKKGGKKGSRSRIEIEKMERTHAAFVGPFLPVSVDKKTIHNEGHDAFYDCTMSM